MRIRYAVKSEMGIKREKNEDSYKINLYEGKHPLLGEGFILFAVADGMGGHPCGEVASQMACEALPGFFQPQGKSSVEELKGALMQVFLSIDKQIKLYTRKNPTCMHMGTTLSVITVFGEKAVIAHVGDTRIYRLRDGILKLLTIDHTFVQEMVEQGVLNAEMAASAPHRNVLTQVVGTDEPLEKVSLQALDIVEGDRFLLSSDGLHDSVNFQDIKSIMAQKNDPKEITRRLLSLALANGGQDDITLIVVHTTGESF